MLALIFGHVTAIDISEKMLQQAATNLGGLRNVTLKIGDGYSLAGLNSGCFDFAFSFIVFQHIPSHEVIRSYCRDVFRVLKPGSLFKFQVQGNTSTRPQPNSTWHGVSVSELDARRLAEEPGFDLELSQGAGTQYFWLWFRKPAFGQC